MAGMRDKVIRLENLTPNAGTNVHFKDTILDISSPGKERDRSDSHLKSVSVEDDDIRLGESAIDEGDVVFPLPDGWPKIPQLFVRRSWDFSTATSPSVNKAVAHLELLQTAIEDWSKEVELEVMSRASSQMKSRAASSASFLAPATQDITFAGQSVVAGSTTSRRQLRFTSPSVLTSAKSGMSRTTRTSRDTQLSIEGIGAKAPEVGPESCSDVDEVVLDIPYLGAEEVVDEVMTLLARLENDRRLARNNLRREQERIAMLQGRIDNMAQQRMEAFAEQVQNEHEACSMDINELNWHVSYRSRIESRIKNKVAIAEVLNSRLKEDIEFVNKHCPLVEEKLELEKEAMERIKQAQHDTNDELSVTVDRCAKVETKSEEAYTKADVERIHLQQEVEQVRIELGNISQELSEEKMLFNSYIHQCNDFRQQLEDNQQELMVLEVKNENAKTAEEMQAAKVRDLQAKIVEQEFEHRKHVDLNTRLETTLATQRDSNRAAEYERVTAIKEKQTHLRNLSLANDELEMDIEDAITTIEKCDKQRIFDDKNLIRMEKEQARTRDQIKVTEDDLAKVRAINNAIREKLEKVEETTASAEETLKATCEQLRKQVKEEIHSRTVIMARINSDNNDLVKSQADAKQKKEKMSKKAEEVEAQVQSVLGKVERLRSANDERVKKFTALKAQIEECLQNQEKLKKQQSEMTDEIGPKHKTLTEDLDGARKQVDHMHWKSDMMKKNMDEMSASFKMMSKSIANTEKLCDKLRDEFDDLHSELTACQHLDEQLKSNIKSLTKRIQEGEMKHKKMKQDRQEALGQHETDLEENMVLNKDLASSYRRLQNEFLRVKNAHLNKYEQRLKLENNLKDLKQLQSLQKRMHSALLEYYKLRGAYNTSELQRMEAESGQNAVSVGGLKTEMDKALDTISHFLRTQMDGTTARKIAMEKVVFEETGQKVDLAISQGAPTIVTLKSSRANSGVSDSMASQSRGTLSVDVMGPPPVIQMTRPSTGAIEVQ